VGYITDVCTHIVDVCTFCSVLSRVLEPTVMMEMSLSDGSVHSFEVIHSPSYYYSYYFTKRAQAASKITVWRLI